MDSSQYVSEYLVPMSSPGHLTTKFKVEQGSLDCSVNFAPLKPTIMFPTRKTKGKRQTSNR